MAPMQWRGPFRIRDYLSHVVRDQELRPPDALGVYVVSEHSWVAPPNREAGIIYVGQAHYLRYRIGQLLMDLLGFTSDDRADGEAYEHRGGHSLWHRYCLERGIEPIDLYFAWYPQCECLDCAEAKLLELVSKEWKVPSRSCGRHIPMLDLLHNCSVLATASTASKRLSEISKN
jgi:hypothetical protein